MTATTYWGDEREPDALYAIYLRKVRYQSPHSGTSSRAIGAKVDMFQKLTWFQKLK